MRLRYKTTAALLLACLSIGTSFGQEKSRNIGHFYFGYSESVATSNVEKDLATAGRIICDGNYILGSSYTLTWEANRWLVGSAVGFYVHSIPHVHKYYNASSRCGCYINDMRTSLYFGRILSPETWKVRLGANAGWTFHVHAFSDSMLDPRARPFSNSAFVSGTASVDIGRRWAVGLSPYLAMRIEKELYLCRDNYECSLYTYGDRHITTFGCRLSLAYRIR